MNTQQQVTPMTTDVFSTYESEARTYCRSITEVFVRAKGCYLFNDKGEQYLDFLSCAGALNYGHNHPELKAKQIEFINSDGLQGALDLHTHAKAEFIEAFQQKVLKPRDMNYKMQFTSPTGTSVVESATKLARKATGRTKLVAFTNGFHGMSGTSLGLTGNRHHRQPNADPNVFRMPFENYMENMDSLAYFEQLLNDKSSGIDIPAAVTVETIQGEGGINVASVDWLRRLREITLEHEILLIIDDIQAGCGRTGKFFSFEHAGICPDMVCLSKSLSGYGYPMSVLLMSDHLDLWLPGEDNGTFRGNSIAMVTAKATIDQFWSNDMLENHMSANEQVIKNVLARFDRDFDHLIDECRGRGMMWGIEFHNPQDAADLISLCRKNHMIVESCGNEDMVIKLFPPLNIDVDNLKKGLDILENSIRAISAEKTQAIVCDGEAA